MNILNSLKQLTLDSPKPVEEVVVESESESESEEESEDEFESEDEYFGEPMVGGFSRYESILLNHWLARPGGPSPCLINAIKFARSRDGDCDLCILAGVDRCCLHGTSNPNVLGSICKDLAFGSVFSTETNRKVFNILGDGDFIEERRNEEIAKSGKEKIYCIVG